MLQIAQNIRQIRVSKGLKPDDVAQKLGVARTTYNNWEKETEPTLTIIKSLADVFGVHYTQIIDGAATDLSKISLITSEPRKPPTLSEVAEVLRVLADVVSKIESKTLQKPSEEKGSPFDEFRADRKRKGNQKSKGKSDTGD